VDILAAPTGSIDWQHGPVTTGYSGTPLVRKLGVKPGMTVYVDVEPRPRVPVDLEAMGLTEEALAEARVVRRLPREADLTLLFCADRSRFEDRLPVVLERTVTAGMIWVCWPKKASKVPTDLDENIVREVALAIGIVDVKVAAVDEVWSGLKLVRRLADR